MIVCLGDLFLDIFLRDPAGLRDPAEQGEGTLPRPLAVLPGGAAANAASWLRHAGAASGLIGAVGGDAAGSMLLADLRARGVSCAVWRSLAASTGLCLYTGAVHESFRAVAERGANDCLELGGRQRALLASASWLHLTAYAFFAPATRHRVLEAVGLARQAGATVSLDLGAAHLARHVGLPEYRHLISAVQAEVLFANEDEARLLMREQDANPLAALTALAETAVLKRGAAGCLARQGGLEFAVPAVTACEVDATGAGDAFAAGVIAALASGRDLPAALQAGVAEGAQCVGLLGGRPQLRERGSGPGLTNGTDQGEGSRPAER